jgi:nitrate/nitrite transporter NarK
MLSRLFSFCVFLAIFLILPIVAFAQEVVEVAAEPAWLPLVISLLAAVAGSSFLSTFLKSGSWYMKIIDAIALNWGKARNDPRVQ